MIIMRPTQKGKEKSGDESDKETAHVSCLTQLEAGTMLWHMLHSHSVQDYVFASELTDCCVNKFQKSMYLLSKQFIDWVIYLWLVTLHIIWPYSDQIYEMRRLKPHSYSFIEAWLFKFPRYSRGLAFAIAVSLLLLGIPNAFTPAASWSPV